MVSRPRSSDGLEEEVIPGHLRSRDLIVRRGRTDGKFRGKDIIPGRRGAGTDHYSFLRAVQNDALVQAKRVRPFGRELDAITAFDRSNMARSHDSGLYLNKEVIE